MAGLSGREMFTLNPDFYDDGDDDGDEEVRARQGGGDGTVHMLTRSVLRLSSSWRAT